MLLDDRLGGPGGGFSSPWRPPQMPQMGMGAPQMPPGWGMGGNQWGMPGYGGSNMTSDMSMPGRPMVAPQMPAPPAIGGGAYNVAPSASPLGYQGQPGLEHMGGPGQPAQPWMPKMAPTAPNLTPPSMLGGGMGARALYPPSGMRSQGLMGGAFG